mgnify:CR=1 FL=1
MAIPLIIIGALILIIGMILALKNIKPMYLNVIAGLIILIGTFFGLFGKQLQDQSSSEKSDKILKTGETTNEKVNSLTVQNTELKTQAVELNNKIDAQANTIDNLRAENADLYSKLSAASKDIYDKITGGESYCVFEVFFDAMSNKPAFNLRHIGNTPLKNVQVTIEDLARRVFLIDNLAKNDYKSPLISQIANNTFYGLEYPSLYPSTSVENIPIPVENGQKDIRMRIWIHLDNGNLFETLEVSNFDDDKKRVYKLELKRGDKVLEKR